MFNKGGHKKNNCTSFLTFKDVTEFEMSIRVNLTVSIITSYWM